MSTKPQSDTPRTDAQPQTWESRGLATSYMTVPRDLARTLERELAAAQERIAELEAELAQMAEFMLARELAIRLNEQPPAPKFLERPDAPGWWWMREPHYKGWRVAGVRMEYKQDESGEKTLVAWLGVGYDVDTINVHNLIGSRWARATPPQWTPTSEELKS